MTRKFTYEEVMDMFGGSIPIEACQTLFNSPDTKTIGEIRAEIVALADRLRTKFVLVPIPPNDEMMEIYKSAFIYRFDGAIVFEKMARASPIKDVIQIETCSEGQHRYAKLPDHPTRDGRPRCPHCMAIGLDRTRA